MCLLNDNVSINWKGAYWKMKSHNCSIFLNVYVILIYVATCAMKSGQQKVKRFSFGLYILVYIR